MANISKQKRDRMLAFLNELKKTHNDDASIRAFNEIENHLVEKKYGLVWEEHTEEVDERLLEEIPVLCEDKERRLCKDENLPWNFIIDGDNLQALYLLEKTHRGKVDCIYIDPPYNTGARDWKYNNDYVDGNDVYRHSKWLSMMKNRLIIAKHLLNPDNSVLICTIDEKEYLRLGCLLEELFPTATIQMISSVINHAGTGGVDIFGRTNEFIYFVMIGEQKVSPQEIVESDGQEVAWDSLRRHNPANLRPTRPSQFYPIYINKNTCKIEEIGDPITPDVDRFSVPARENCVTVFPVKDNGVEMMWGIVPDEARRRNANGYIKVGKYQPDKPQQFSLQFLSAGTISAIEKGTVKIIGKRKDDSVIAVYQGQKKILPKTQWDKDTHDATHYGTKMLKAILGGRFNYPKSLYAVADCLRYFVSDKKNAIILDFFAGSGTTMHAVNFLNAEDGGGRVCIMATNNEVSLDESQKLAQAGYKKGDEKWESLGIAKYVTWPRTVCSIEGKDINGKELKGEYITTTDKKIKMSDGFNANVKYFKCDWTPRKPEDYLLSNALCLHIKEMIELQTGREVDGKKNVLILNRDDLSKHILNAESYAMVENIWLNQNMILTSDEMKLLNEKGFKYIPREYFGQELREAAE